MFHTGTEADRERQVHATLTQLFASFAKVGALLFGGGYAMLPLLEREVVNRRGWCSFDEMTDYYAMSQLVPGVVAINTAMLIGHRLRGFWGTVVATLAVCLPSLLCVNLLGAFWRRNRNHPCMVRVFEVLRPLVTGLVITAAVLLVLESLWGDSFREAVRRLPDLQAAVIAAAAFALTAFTRVSPVYTLLGGAAAGCLLRGAFLF